MANRGAIVRTIGLTVAFALVIALIVASRGHTQPATPAAKVLATGTVAPRKWVVGHAQIPNVVMHWKEFLYIGPATTPDDPGVGKVTPSEHWVETDGSGNEIFQHTIFTLPDGSLYQETFDNAQESIIVRGPGYYGVFGNANDPSWCVSKAAPQSLKGYQFPTYVDMQQLQTDGFAVSTASSAGEAIPSAPTQISEVATTYALPTTYQVWTHTGPSSPSGYTEKVRFATDSQGRIVSYDRQLTEQSGRLKSDQWYSISQIDVYPSTMTLPSLVKQEPIQVTEGCK